MGLTVSAIGTAIPEQSVTREEAVEIAKLTVPKREHGKLDRIYKGTGVEKRHSVMLKERAGANAPAYDLFYVPDEEDDRGPRTSERMQAYMERAHPLAERAMREALLRGGLEPDEVTHLVLVSCSGFFAPGVDIRLIKSLGLPFNLERVQVGFMGCQGALNGLRVANGLAHTRPDAQILMCAVELCSVHYRYGWTLNSAVANSLFADGSAALVGRSQGDGWKLRASGACLVPDSEDAMSWRIGDHGFEMGLATSVPRLIEANLRPWAQSWLAQHGYGFDDIATWAVHPGGPTILRNVQRALDLKDGALDVSLGVLQEMGNMSSPTILFILERLLAAGASMPCVGMAFGPGLTVEAVLFDD